MKTLWLGIRLGSLGIVLCAVSLAQAPQGSRTIDATVAAWLKLWGEDVGYNGSYDQEHEAFKALLALGPAAVPALVQALRQSTNQSSVDWWTRDNAAFLLERMGPQAKSAVPDLITLLGHQNNDLRSWAAAILGFIGPAASNAVPRLIQLLDDRTVIRGDAASALGQIGAREQSVVPALMSLLHDNDSEVQHRAIVSLGKFGPRAAGAVEMLLPLLQSPEKTIRETAAWALHKIEPGQEKFIQEQLAVAAEAERARKNSHFRGDPGLFCLAMPETNRIEEGMVLPVKLQVWAAPQELPPGVKHFNAFLIQRNLKLHLTNQITRQAFVLNIEPDNGPWFNFDEGKQAQALDGTKQGPWEADFRLVRLRADLRPGGYDCAVELAYPKDRPTQWSEKAPDWKSFGFWSGRILSPVFELTVLKETPKKQKLVVPGQPHLVKGKNGAFALVLRKEEFSTIEVAVRNGFFLGQDVIAPNGDRTLQSGIPEESSELEFPIPGRVKWPKYRARIFETAVPPGHLWDPGVGTDDFKLLWESRFETNLLSQADLELLGLSAISKSR